MKGEVCIENSCQGDIGEIETLGDHLGAKQNVDLAGSEVTQCITEGVFLAGCIGIEAGESRSGKYLFENFLYLLCSISLKEDRAVMAFWAGLRDDGLVSTEMADQPLFGPVVGERDSAVLALADVPTAGALERAGKTTAVEEENDLLTLFQFFFHVHAEAFREDGGSPLLFFCLHSHVHDADERKGLTVCTFGEAQEFVLS